MIVNKWIIHVNKTNVFYFAVNEMINKFDPLIL